MAQITVYDEIRSMLQANFPLIYLATTEYNRVMQKVRSLAFGLGYKFNTWDSVDGLKNFPEDVLKTSKIIQLQATLRIRWPFWSISATDLFAKGTRNPRCSPWRTSISFSPSVRCRRCCASSPWSSRTATST